MDTQILEDIGLTGAEIKVFIALLELGPSFAGKVVESSGLQNAVVHRAFHSLTNKGLISFILEGRRRKYQAISPKQLLVFLDEKKAKLEKLMPFLEAKQEGQKEKASTTTYHGVRGVKEAIHLMLETNAREYVAYGGPQKAHDLLGDFFWEHLHKKRIKKKIKARLVFHASLCWWAKEMNKTFSLTKVRVTEKAFEALTETIICGDRVCIVVYLDKPIALVIEESLAAESYKKFFEVVWKSAH